ncbi:MAG: PTS sugar transporter subunit IIC, partial [Clostridia bacterium]|nr:PTS sugar transporter subunit IIC [Clostridia bacterium]
MEKIRAFLKRKDIVISARRYGIDAMGAMAQGLFCSLLIGTIINTIGTQFSVPFLNEIGGYATAMSGPAMAIAIGWALK